MLAAELPYLKCSTPCTNASVVSAHVGSYLSGAKHVVLQAGVAAGDKFESLRQWASGRLFPRIGRGFIPVSSSLHPVVTPPRFL